MNSFFISNPKCVNRMEFTVYNRIDSFWSLLGFVHIFNTVCAKCHCIMPLSSISNVLWITSKVLFDRGNIKINYFLWSTFPFVLHINLFSRFLEVLRIFIAYFNDKNVESFESGNWIMLLPVFGRKCNWLYLSGRIYTWAYKCIYMRTVNIDCKWYVEL